MSYRAILYYYFKKKENNNIDEILHMFKRNLNIFGSLRTLEGQVISFNQICHHVSQFRSSNYIVV